MEQVDVIVIGAGVVGSAAAAALAGSRRVLVLEQFDLLHERGSSHGGSRIFRHAYPDERYVRLAFAADEGWQALERDTGERLLLRTGGLDIAAEKSEALQGIEGALTAAGGRHERLSPGEVARRFPAFAPAADRSALFQPDAGILAAGRCVAALLRLASERGALVQDNEPAVEVALGDTIEVVTPRDRYRAAALVVAAGPWLGRVVHLDVDLVVEQQQVIYLRVPPGEHFSPGRMPIFIDHGRDSEVYGFPRFEHPTAIKVADHAGAPATAPDTRSFDLDGARAARTIARVRALLPEVSETQVRFETCLYTKTPDEHFVLDRLPDLDNVVVAGGFSGHGFKFAPALAEAVADLIAARRSRHDLSLFALDRFTAQAGATE